MSTDGLTPMETPTPEPRRTPPPAPRRKKTPWVVGILGLVAIAGAVARLLLISGDPEIPPTVEELRGLEGIPVVVEAAVRGDLEVWRSFSGTVTGERESILRAKNDDEIREVRARVGQRVQAGELLVRQGSRATDARVRQVQAALDQVERLVARLQPLWEAGALSDQEWEEANTQLALARADRDAIGDLQNGRAPIRGIVTEVPARVGQIPAQGQPLVRIVDDAAFRIPLRLSPEQAREIIEGQIVRTVSEPEVAEGRVDRISIQADLRSRLVEVDALFPAATAGSLRPGSFVSVQIQVDQVEDALLIPRTALRPEGVWILNGEGRAQLRSVTTGVSGDRQIEITSGLVAGDQVITEGASLLSENARVRVVN
jgi:RND family efflux transporter MFP subunit